MATQSPRKPTANDYTVGWICALPLELTASEGMLDRVHEALRVAEGDKNQYILGEIHGHNIAMACLPTGSIGQTSAATVAADMMHSFPRIRFGLMVGIGGGAPNPNARPDEDIRLGDVVVSIPHGELGAVIKYDRGKVVAGGEFQPTGILNVPPSMLTTAVSTLRSKHETLKNSISRNVTDMIQRKHKAEDANREYLQRYRYPGAEHDQLFEADYEHVEQGHVSHSVSQEPEDNASDPSGHLAFPCPRCDKRRLVPRHPRPETDPVIHYGTIASADLVMRHGETREKLRKKYGILCFEMEAAGLMNDFPCLVIRGICDYSDTHKHKIWQRYAAATAAAYAKELLGTVQKAEVVEPCSGTTKEEIDKMRKELEDIKKDRPQQRQTQERDKILNWLDSDTHTKKWADSRAKRHRDTGKTFVESQTFLNWINNQTQTLWCHGIAGSGKTIFASLVVDRLHAAQRERAPNEKAAIVCLYLEYERIQEQSLQPLLAAILRQLVHQCTEIPRSVTELYSTHTTNQSQPLLDEISSVLVDVSRNFPRVFLVVDALDECSEDTARDLLSDLSDYQKSTGMKLLATSRRTIDFGEFFEEYESMEIKAQEDDVKAVLDTLIQRLPKLVRENKDLQAKIKQTIVEAVDGMFVLVEPFLYSLRSERTVGDINDALRALKESPDKIATVYQRTLKRIDGHTLKDQQIARRILVWTILAKRSLSCREFQHALNVRIGKDFDKDYFEGNLEESVALCAGLVVINKKSDSVQLMHQTARIYFKNPANRPDWLCSANETIASSCVSYLSFSALSAGPCSSDDRLRARLRKFPLLAYAAQEWGNHIRESDEATGQAEDLALLFLRMESNVWSSHQVLHLPAYRYRGYSQFFTKGANGLQLAASFGLTKMVGQLLDKGADVSTTDEDGGTALHRAAENGHVDVVLLLIQKGVDINLQKKTHRHTALHLAALNGHSRVVETLLQQGAHANLQDDEGWNALHVAAWTGKKDVVDVLLEQMDVHERGKDGVTALHCAAGQGQRAVAELLIDRGADVNTKDSYGWTALHWASKKRHDLAKLRQLEFKDEASTWAEQLKKVTKVTGMLRDTFNLPKKLAMIGIGEPAGKEWEDDLAYASDGFALDLNTKDRGMLATLYFSTKVDQFVPPWLLPKPQEQIATVRMILAVQDELAALQCLVQCGHGAVARLLLDRGAHVDAKCRAVVATKFRIKMSARPTALHMAGLSGHEPMVKMLLDKGADTEAVCEVGLGEGWLNAKLTALHCAVVSGNKQAVRLFLDNGANINATCHAEFKNIKARITSLHLAVIWGHLEVVKLLLACGLRATTPCYLTADKSVKSQRGIRYMQLNLNLTTDIELPAIHLASIFGNRDVMRELVQNGVDCTSQLRARIDFLHFNLAPLHVAAFLGHVDIVELLLTYGVSIDANAQVGVDDKSRLCVNALQLAALSNSRAVVKQLLSKGANVHAKGQVDNDDYAHAEWTALHLAALGGNAATVRLLLKAGADVHEKLQGDMSSQFPLTTEHIMARTANMFAALLGDELLPSSFFGKTNTSQRTDGQADQKAHFELNALHLASMSGNEPKVKVLLEFGANVNSKCIIEAKDMLLEAMPLHLAAIWNRDTGNLRRSLIEAGALVDGKFRAMVGKILHLEMTSMHLAALVGDEDAILDRFFLLPFAQETSLSNGGSPRSTNNLALICVGKVRIEMSAIHLAAVKGNTTVTNFLLMNGSNIGMPCSIKLPSAEISLTPFQIAAAMKHSKLLKMLVSNGADANQQVQIKSKTGNGCITPLHLMLLLGYRKSRTDSHDGLTTSSLLEKGVDVSLPFLVDFIPRVRIELSVLHLAAMVGNWKVMEQLLERGADPATKGSVTIRKTHLDVSMLFLATFWERENVVKSLIEAGADVNEVCCFTIGTRLKANFTALHVAALTGQTSTVQLLLQNGATAHLNNEELDGSITQSNVSPLHLALLMDNVEATKLLISHGASVIPNLQVATRRFRAVLSTLNLAGLFSHMPLVKLLTKKGVDVNAISMIQFRGVEIKFTALHLAAIMRKQMMLVYLLKHGADVHQALQINIGHSSIRLSPLHLATLVKGRKQVRVLLKYKADARAEVQCTGDKWYITGTSLHLSTFCNRFHITDLLLNNGAQTHDRFQVGLFNVNAELKAIHFAIARGSKEMVQTLLDKGGDDDTGLKLSVHNLGTQLSALHLALLLNRESLVELLLAKGVDLCASYTVGVSKKFQAEVSALHLATLSGKEGIPGLFENEVDIHAQSLASIDMIIQFELKILDVITVFRTQEVTEPLLKKAMQDQEEQPGGLGRNLALYLATALGYKTVLKLLLERADDVDEKLSVKIQATVEAAFEGKLQNQVGAAVELKIETELSVFHLATILGNIDAARLLIDKGADINAKCQIRVQDGLQADLTPLMLAAMWKHDGMVQLLLEKGANVSHTGQARIERTVHTSMIAPHLSAMLGHGVTRILQKADSFEARMKAELTGLHLAVILGDVAVINRFLEHDADPDMRCQADIEVKHQDNVNANVQVQLTPLHLAAWAGHETVAVRLIKGGAEVDEKIQAGGTAALNFGMRIDQKMQPGATALHVAVSLGKEKVARVLIDHGADVGAKTRDGRTTLQCADGPDGESMAQVIRDSEKEKSPETTAKDKKKGFLKKLHKLFHAKSEGNGSRSKKGS